MNIVNEFLKYICQSSLKLNATVFVHYWKIPNEYCKENQVENSLSLFSVVDGYA